MNNGVRVSIILAVITIAMLGLYYASLEDPEATVVASTEPPIQEVILETDLEAPVDEPEPPMETFPESEPAGSSDIREVETADPDPLLDVQVSDAGADAVEDDSEPNTESLDAANDSTMESPGRSEAPPAATAEMGEEPTTTAPVESVDAPAPDATEPQTEPQTDAQPDPGTGPDGDAPSESTRSETDPPRGRAPVLGRPVDQPGVGMHRLVAPGDESVDLNRAVRLLQSRETGNVADDATGTAWIVVPDRFVESISDVAITEPQGDDVLVLVRTDTRGSLGLSGDVSSARVVLEPNGINHGVNFRIEPQSINTVSSASLNLVRVPLAWVQDGRIVLVETRPISISGQGRIAGGFDRATADRLALGLLADPAVSAPVATRPSPAESTPVDPGSVVLPGNPGGLPADAYVEYTVQSGETFESIAGMWFGDTSRFSDISRANPLVDPNNIALGQVIKLPPRDLPRRIVVDPPDAQGVRIHEVRSGETLSDIALAAYGKSSKWTVIYEANKAMIGPDSSKLQVGMELVIP